MEKHLRDLLDEIQNLGLKFNIQKGSQFFDEPNFHIFTSKMRNARQYTDGYIKEEAPPGSGFSFNSPEDALSKSLYELIERFSLTCYRKKDIIYEKYDKERSVNPEYFTKDANIKNKSLGWVAGESILDNKKIHLPAQLVYLNYLRSKKEAILAFPRNSNGAAGGNSREEAILSGIYEVVERDSFMNFYLNKIVPFKIDLQPETDDEFKLIIEKTKKYLLELFILDITTDLGIPVYLSILIDKTGIGPAISIGAKAGFNTKKTILSAIGESFMIRMYVKYMLKDGIIFGKDEAKRGNIFADRAEYWFSPEKIRKLKFLISGEEKQLRKEAQFSFDEEFSTVKEKISEKSLNIYAKDVSVVNFRKHSYVYKVIIPELQSLYLKESEKKEALNKRRLEEVAGFFNRKSVINLAPHPFL